MGERALHDPALDAESGAVLGASAGDQRLHAEIPDESALLVVVVAAVAQQHLWAAPGPAASLSSSPDCQRYRTTLQTATASAHQEALRPADDMPHESENLPETCNNG